MEIINREPGTLRGYEHDARTHSEEQIAQIAESIERYGFNVPILIDGASNIIAGRGRLAAAMKLHLPTVPCILLDHLTDEQRRAYILVDNRLSDLSSFDDEKLRAELAALLALDTPLVGFDDFLLDEDGGGLSAKKNNLKKINLKVPEMAWVLIGIPLVRYGEIQDVVDGLAIVPDVSLHTTVSNK